MEIGDKTVTRVEINDASNLSFVVVPAVSNNRIRIISYVVNVKTEDTITLSSDSEIIHKLFLGARSGYEYIGKPITLLSGEKLGITKETANTNITGYVDYGYIK